MKRSAFLNLKSRRRVRPLGPEVPPTSSVESRAGSSSLPSLRGFLNLTEFGVDYIR